jgi:enoyl-CoA hydratase/carnithine racemase
MTDQKENLLEWEAWKEWETLKLETNKAYPQIGLLRLNRPDKLNAVSYTMVNDFHSCFDFLDNAFECRVLIICGEGRLFCAGLDLSGVDSDTEKYPWRDFPEKIKSSWYSQYTISEIFEKLRRIPQPVIASVHKAAVGIGMALCNASDIVVASRDTRFINAFIKIGFSGADCGSSYYLPRILGFHRSAELLYSGRDLSAEEAYNWGYVNILADKAEETLPKAVEFAAEYMLTKSPLGLRLTKEALNLNIDAASPETAIRLEDRNQVLCGQSTDTVEAITAFFEKRRPNFGSK